MSTAAGISGFGLQYSGVRQIAKAIGSEKSDEVVSVRLTLRFLTVALAIIGGLCLVLVSKKVSIFTFGETAYTGPISLLAIGVAASVLTGALTAWLTAFRMIGSIAKMNVIAGVAGTAVAIMLVISFGENGVAPLVAAGALASLFAAAWFVRKAPINSAHVCFQEIFKQSKPLIGLGLAFMSGSVMAGLALYLARVLVIRELGLEATGHFQAAWGLSMLVMSIVLNAMGSDFYPRLASLGKDQMGANRLVNEQTEFCLYLLAPVLLGTITFSQPVVSLFYSPSFKPAAGILQWQSLGNVLKVVGYGVGSIIHARGFAFTFFITELIFNFAFVTIIVGGLPVAGLLITGIAYFSGQLIYLVLVFALVYHFNAFRWSKKNLFHTIGILLAGGIIMAASIFSQILSWFLGTLAVAIAILNLFRFSSSLIGATGKGVERIISFFRWFHKAP